MEDTQELLIAQSQNGQDAHTSSMQILNNAVFQNWWGSSQQPQPTSRSQRVSCEYCREVCLAQHYEHHKRICRRNPGNLRESSEFIPTEIIPTERVRVVVSTERARTTEPTDNNSSSNLNKTVCEFCNELCYLRFHEDHRRVCVKNPENIKVICRFCTKTFCQVSFQSHVEVCAEKMQYKENTFLLRLEELAKREDGDLSSSEQLAEGDCPICIEEIKKHSESRKLTCGHRFHRRCIEMWARRQKRCPICRKGFV